LADSLLNRSSRVALLAGKTKKLPNAKIVK